MHDQNTCVQRHLMSCGSFPTLTVLVGFVVPLVFSCLLSCTNIEGLQPVKILVFRY